MYTYVYKYVTNHIFQTQQKKGEHVSWDDLPGDPRVKARVFQLIVDPIRRPERLLRLNVRPISGYG